MENVKKGRRKDQTKRMEWNGSHEKRTKENRSKTANTIEGGGGKRTTIFHAYHKNKDSKPLEVLSISWLYKLQSAKQAEVRAPQI